MSTIKMKKPRPIYFVEHVKDLGWQVREDHEQTLGILGGSGLVETYATEAQARAKANELNQTH